MVFISYAQNYEDVMLRRALKGVEKGFYIDVGAQDPVSESVTKAFYESGWRGINLEPIEYWFERITKDRPEDINLQVAASSHHGHSQFYEILNSGLSTLDKDVAERHVAQGFEIRLQNVPTIPLSRICETYGVNLIHFLKIDVEGAELDVLRGMNLEDIRPWIILIEATEPNTQITTHHRWEHILLKYNYEFVYFDGLNRFYVAQEKGHLKEAFSSPPNVFDEFIRYAEWQARHAVKFLEEALVKCQSDIARLKQGLQYSKTPLEVGANRTDDTSVDKALLDQSPVHQEMQQPENPDLFDNHIKDGCVPTAMFNDMSGAYKEWEFVGPVEVVGYLSGTLGLAVAAQNLVRSLRMAGVGVNGLNVLLDQREEQMAPDLLSVLQHEQAARSRIVALGPHEYRLLQQNHPGLFDDGLFTCGWFFWETPEAPAGWKPVLEQMDLLVCPTTFIQQALRTVSDRPSVVIPPALDVPDALPPGTARAGLGLTSNHTLFLTAFDCMSTVVRKNPWGAVQAFLRAFPRPGRAQLIVKVLNGNSFPDVLTALERAVKGRRDIHLLNTWLSRDEMLKLVQACDAVVSLHRAEGFGLPLAEAMWLGKVAIGTGWSGNMDFMNEHNSAPVRHRLIENREMNPHYPVGTVWADPDIGHAAEMMRRVSEDRPWAQHIGEEAARSVRRTLSQEAVGRRWLEVLREAVPPDHDAGEKPAPGAPRPAAIHLHAGKALGNEDLYRQWQENHVFRPAQVSWIEERLAAWPEKPVFHLAVIVLPGSEERLPATLESLAGQHYSHWRLSVIATSTPPAGIEVVSAIDWVNAGDCPLETANGILSASDADWVGLIEAGDRLAPHALFACADAAARHPQWQLLYSDEDSLDLQGERRTPHFKPDFNLDLLRSLPYMGALMLLRRACFAAAGGFDPGRDGAEDYDLALRAFEACGADGIGHVADVLYHRGLNTGHSACSVEQVVETGRQALAAHLDRLGVAATAEYGAFPPSYRVRYRHADRPRVSVIIPTRDQIALLQRCIESLIEKTGYPNYEILIVDNDSQTPEARTYLEGLRQVDENAVRVLSYPHPFNFSAMNNLAARAARGEYLLLLNNDTAVLHPDWLDAMMDHAQRPEVGIVGARLLYPDGRIQHAGVVLGMKGPADHAFIGQGNDSRGYFGRLQLEQEYSAVTGACLLIRKSLYDEVGGLDEERFQVSYNDIDLCLKVRERGQRIVWTPFASLLHEGSASQHGDVEKTADQRKQARFAAEQDAFYQKWRYRLAFDPAYNRNLSLANAQFTVESEACLTWDPEWRPRPRILVQPADRSGCGEYRIIAPMRALNAAGKAQGWESMRIFAPTELGRMDPDSIVLQRQLEWFQIEAIERHRQHSRAFRIFEIDDLITNLPTKSVHKASIHKDIAKRFRKALSLCDRLVVATEPLAEAYRGFIDDIRVVPNFIEEARWGHLTPRRRQGTKPRVGWAGGISHSGDLELITDVVKALADEVDWVFFGMCPASMRPYIREFHAPVAIDAFPAKLASLDLDLAIAPLEENPFNAAKSHLRILEYGILGYPVVCTDITPYREAPVTRVKNRFKDWLKAIQEQLSDPDANARAGDGLRDYVRRHWLLENNPEAWLRGWLP